MDTARIIDRDGLAVTREALEPQGCTTYAVSQQAWTSYLALHQSLARVWQHQAHLSVETEHNVGISMRCRQSSQRIFTKGQL